MDKSAEWLAIVAKKHNEWINIVKSFGEKSYYEDIVQQMYIALYKYSSKEKIIKDGIVSNGYIYFTLRSIYFQYYNSKKKVKKISIDNEEYFYEIPDDTQMDEQIAFNKLCKLIDNEVESWEWYNKKLFKIYRDTPLSIRGIANETNISWVSIFNSLKNAKKKIKNKFQEDWDDYENNDFELI